MGPDLIHSSAVIDPKAELAAGVRVGPYSVIGPDVHLGAGTEVGAHVVLEGRVRIGARSRIGHGAVIGAKSLVVKSVPPYAIVKGSPATVVKYRFSDRDIGKLLSLQWWTWDRKLICRAVNEKLLCG